MKTFSKLAVIAAVATAVTAGSAFAADAPATEKCYGVAKAGKNDCKGGGAAACAGHSTKDGQGFINVPAGICERIAGGSTTEPK